MILKQNRTPKEIMAICIEYILQRMVEVLMWYASPMVRQLTIKHKTASATFLLHLFTGMAPRF